MYWVVPPDSHVPGDRGIEACNSASHNNHKCKTAVGIAVIIHIAIHC